MLMPRDLKVWSALIGVLVEGLGRPRPSHGGVERFFLRHGVDGVRPDKRFDVLVGVPVFVLVLAHRRCGFAPEPEFREVRPSKISW